MDLLSILHSKGLVILLENTETADESWIIINKEVLIAEVNGILFAPREKSI